MNTYFRIHLRRWPSAVLVAERSTLRLRGGLRLWLRLVLRRRGLRDRLLCRFACRRCGEGDGEREYERDELRLLPLALSSDRLSLS